jgi:uncharacterized protein YjbJ (UPF0337 family)
MAHRMMGSHRRQADIFNLQGHLVENLSQRAAYVILHIRDKTTHRDFLSQKANFQRRPSFFTRAIAKESPCMDREHVKGTAEKAKGAIKDTAGKVTGDKKLQSEGKFEKAKGSIHKVAGDIKDAMKRNK